MNSFLDFLVSLGAFVYAHHQNQLISKDLLEHGWFRHGRMAFTMKSPQESIDGYMERGIIENYEAIKEGYCYQTYPDRKHVLEEAFRLFEEKRYIACIPLFLTQIDGISKDIGTTGFFMGKKEGPKVPPNEKRFSYFCSELPEGEKKEMLDLFYSEFLGKESEKSYIHKRTDDVRRHNEIEDIGYLNRHGILHGNIDYIKYGTRINALKLISMLMFVISVVEIVKDRHEISLNT